MVEIWVPHTASLRWRFDQSFKKILPRPIEMWRGHKIQGSNSWPSTVTLTLSQHGWFMSSAHHICKENSWLKLNENRLRDERDMEQTWNARLKHMTLTLGPHGRIMDSANSRCEENIWLKVNENPFTAKGGMEWTKNARLKLLTFDCDLDLESAWLNYGFCTPSHWGEHFTEAEWQFNLMLYFFKQGFLRARRPLAGFLIY